MTGPEHQKRMMREVVKLTTDRDGALESADNERMMATPLVGGSDPIITREPEGAWSSEFSDAVLNRGGPNGRHGVAPIEPRFCCVRPGHQTRDDAPV